MAAKSGAGASVSSGASYQAQIGAHLVVSSLCQSPSAILDGSVLAAIGFETTEAVDDINIETTDQTNIYIQAKAKLSYSTRADSEFRSVWDQFLRQQRARPDRADRFLLVTSDQSSRKIVYDTRAALDAYRTGTDKSFRRDQPKAIVDIIQDIRSMVMELGAPQDTECSVEDVNNILRKSYVIPFDCDQNTPIEQGMMIALNANRYTCPPLMWGKIVNDCVSHSKNRATITADVLRDSYKKFVSDNGESSTNARHDLLEIELDNMAFSVGREVILCELPENDLCDAGLAIVEVFRFDEDGNERTAIGEETCVFGGSLEARLIRRASTYKGIERLIEASPSLIRERSQPVTFLPINKDENVKDCETSLAAEAHRKRLRKALKENRNLFECVHCAKPISSNNVHVIELLPQNDLQAGICHGDCLQPSDRLLGTIKSNLFETYSELVNFDYEGWQTAAKHGGQAVMSTLDKARATGKNAVIVWGGKCAKQPLGSYVVEVLLSGGRREFCFSRNQIDRFPKQDAERFVERLNHNFAANKLDDPICFSDQSKAFGPKSQLLEILGGTERLDVCESARIRPYNQKFAARFEKPGFWYAPLFYLRSLSSDEPIEVNGVLPILTAPFDLKNYIENWQECGFQIDGYETVSILSDADFDAFMFWVDEHSKVTIADPLFSGPPDLELLSGSPITPIDAITRQK